MYFVVNVMLSVYYVLCIPYTSSSAIFVYHTSRLHSRCSRCIHHIIVFLHALYPETHSLFSPVSLGSFFVPRFSCILCCFSCIVLLCIVSLIHPVFCNVYCFSCVLCIVYHVLFLLCCFSYIVSHYITPSQQAAGSWSNCS